jgi:hypothetical protein
MTGLHSLHSPFVVQMQNNRVLSYIAIIGKARLWVNGLEFDVIDVEICVRRVHGGKYEHMLAAVDVIGIHLSPSGPGIVGRDARGHREVGPDLRPRAGVEIPGVEAEDAGVDVG